MLANKTFLSVDQSSPNFFHGTREESLSITFVFDFGYLESFRRYSRSKSKVVENRAEFFWTFFRLPNFRGRPSKSHTHVMIPASRHVVWKMFFGILPLAPKLYWLTRWILSQILNFHDYNFLETPVPLRMCAIKAWSISSAWKKIQGAAPLYGLKYRVGQKNWTIFESL